MPARVGRTLYFIMTESKKRYERQRYLDHINERRAYQRKYYEEHREDILLRKRAKRLGCVEAPEPNGVKMQREKLRRKIANRTYYMKNRENIISKVIKRRKDKMVPTVEAE